MSSPAESSDSSEESSDESSERSIDEDNSELEAGYHDQSSADSESDSGNGDESDESDESDEINGNVDNIEGVGDEDDSHNGDSGDDALFSDDEDREAFGGDRTSRELYSRRIRFFKRPDNYYLSGDSIDLWEDEDYGKLSPRAWSRLGLFWGRTPQLTSLEMSGCGITESGIIALMAGFEQSHLERLLLDEVPSFSNLGAMEALCTFLRGKGSNSFVLHLGGCQLDVECLEMLANTMQHCGIKELYLNDNHFGVQGDENRISLLVHNLVSTNLTVLLMKRCNMGIEWCRAFANVMGNTQLKLRSLDLGSNRLNDECASILADALVNNTFLKDLILEGNAITDTGGTYFYQILCNKTSIQSTYESNHSLHNVILSLGDCSYSQMTRINLMSKNVSMAARSKVAIVHFSHGYRGYDEAFDIRPIMNLDVKVIPHLLAWFTKGSIYGYSDHDRLCSVNRIVRHWNARVLFGFPSAEKTRIWSLVEKLEDENISLKSKVSTLEGENNRLREENLHLKSQTSEIINQQMISKLEAEIDQLKRENVLLKSGENATISGRKRKEIDPK